MKEKETIDAERILDVLINLKSKPLENKPRHKKQSNKQLLINGLVQYGIVPGNYFNGIISRTAVPHYMKSRLNQYVFTTKETYTNREKKEKTLDFFCLKPDAETYLKLLKKYEDRGLKWEFIRSPYGQLVLNKYDGLGISLMVRCYVNLYCQLVEKEQNKPIHNDLKEEVLREITIPPRMIELLMNSQFSQRLSAIAGNDTIIKRDFEILDLATKLWLVEYLNAKDQEKEFCLKQYNTFRQINGLLQSHKTKFIQREKDINNQQK